MSVYKFTLEREYQFTLPFSVGSTKKFKDKNGKIWLTLFADQGIIHEGYSWDGCSPKREVLGRVVGTWDGELHDFRFTHGLLDFDQKLKYASLVHDALCQFTDDLPDVLSQKIVDKMFLADMKYVKFKYAYPYYWAVRFFQKNIKKRY